MLKINSNMQLQKRNKKEFDAKKTSTSNKKSNKNKKLETKMLGKKEYMANAKDILKRRKALQDNKKSNQRKKEFENSLIMIKPTNSSKTKIDSESSRSVIKLIISRNISIV